jgi:hypothetical protein
MMFIDDQAIQKSSRILDLVKIKGYSQQRSDGFIYTNMDALKLKGILQQNFIMSISPQKKKKPLHIRHEVNAVLT